MKRYVSRFTPRPPSARLLEGATAGRLSLVRRRPGGEIILCLLVAALILSGCGSAAPTSTPTATLIPPSATIRPTVTRTRTPLPSLTPSITPGGPTTAQPVTGGAPPAISPTGSSLGPPTATSALAASTPSTNVPPQPTIPLVSQGNAPPLTISLPPKWASTYRVVAISDQLAQTTMNEADYVGPIGSATGTIIVLWGFPSLGAPSTLANPQVTLTQTADPNAPDPDAQLLWADGLRLLQGSVVSITCNVGQYGQRTFTIGGKPGVGAYFQVVQCQGEPDTAGWFVGLRQSGRSFLFYMFVDPITAYNDARKDLQAILDTVVFAPPGSGAPTAVPTTAPPTSTPNVPPGPTLPITPTTTPVLQ